MFERVKQFYDLGLYTAYHVARFVEKGKITEAEYQIITGETYRRRDDAK